MKLINDIARRWEYGWVPKGKVLTHHLTHILGGLVFFFAAMVLTPLEPLGSVLVTTALAIAAEIIGLIAGETKVNAVHDFIQYTFCWPFYGLIAVSWQWFAILFVSWTILYFMLLLKKPSE